MIGLLIIGDEILSGRRADKHLAKSIEILNQRGLTLSWARYVGDEPERITAELKSALAGKEVVFSFGGIGATPDDHTRACAGAAWGRVRTAHSERGNESRSLPDRDCGGNPGDDNRAVLPQAAARSQSDGDVGPRGINFSLVVNRCGTQPTPSCGRAQTPSAGFFH